jgi:hypothetical protein
MKTQGNLTAVSALKFALTWLIIVALAHHASAFASFDEPVTEAEARPKTEELHFSISGTRLAGELFWSIDSSGKGRLRAPDSVGYTPVQLLANDPVYRIAPGTHEFDIGATGFAELRQFLALVIDVRRDPAAALTKDLGCLPAMGSGFVGLNWTGKGGGRLTLPNDCITPFGAQFKDRMIESWFLLARAMHAAGHPAVTITEQPVLPVPARIAFTERGIWNPSSIQWEVDGTGKGWFKKWPAINGWTGHEPYRPDGGRQWFQLDAAFHQAILRSFAPYLDGTAKPGSCEDEITTSDQPMVRIEWTDASGAAQSYQSDLGCPSFAARMGLAKAMFHVLLEKGELGGAQMLFGKR